MAFSLKTLQGLIVVMMAFYNQEVLGNSTSLVSPSPTISVKSIETSTAPVVASSNYSSVQYSGNATVGMISPSATQTVAPSSSAAPAEKFDTQVMASLQFDKSCSDVKINEIKDVIKDLYKTGYDYKYSNFTTTDSNEKCIVNITMNFGINLYKTDIIAKFENTTGSDAAIKGKLLSINAHVEGVKLGEKWEASDDECQQKCCATGGPISLNRTCDPADKCVNYILSKTEPDCSKYCTCAGTILKVSLLLLLLNGLINWILKE